MNAPRAKLMLYSDQIPPKTDRADDRLLALLGKNRVRMAYVGSGPDPERTFYAARESYYARLGIELLPFVEVEDIQRGAHLEALLNADAIHLSGGKTFAFLDRLRTYQLFDPLRRFAVDGGVLVGVSAGAVLMTPSVRTGLLCGDSPPAEVSDPSGLGLVDFAFVPHLGRYASIVELEAYSRQNAQLLYACADGAAIAVDGGAVECIGDVVRIDAGVGGPRA
ncbi:MAG: Type 1 glutamine amidotransferase-like domain-containing protein [Myxococcota bacterium]